MLKSDWVRFDTMTDEDIDYSDIPPLTNEQLQHMRPLGEVLPQVLSNRVQVTIQLDADIVEWFTKVGQIGERNSHNLVLRQYIANHLVTPVQNPG